MSLLLCLLVWSGVAMQAQTTESDGDYAAKTALIWNGPQAELMVRVGDIDNLGFGWPTNFNPFSGNSTPAHSYPWMANAEDPDGTDRIMVISSYDGHAPHGQDGYTSNTSRPANSVRPIELIYPADSITITSVIIQIFVDDFQAPVWGASYEVTIDGVRIPELENIINQLVQTGPIGKLITLQIPSNYLYLFDDGKIDLKFDDTTTGAGDGYAVDFVKLLINPVELRQYCTVKGTVTNYSNGGNLSGVKVTAGGIKSAYTDSNGIYTIDSVAPGIISVNTYKNGFGSQTKLIDLAAGNTGTLNFQLKTPAPKIVSVSPDQNAANVDVHTTISVSFDTLMNKNTFTSSNIIFYSGNGNLGGTFEKNDSGFVFVPNSALKFNNDYHIVLTTGIQNADGVSLEQSETFYFNTDTVTIPSLINETSISKKIAIYPNPSVDYVWINYSLDKPGKVDVIVTDLTGRQIENKLLNEDAGEHSLKLDLSENGANINTGTSILQIRIDNEVYNQKIVLIKK